MAEAVVEYDYDAEQEDELTLRVGDVIKNVVTADGGWWEGELKGKKGMFPDNFVKLRVKDSGPKKGEKREAAQRKSVRELASKFKDGVPLPGTQASIMQRRKEAPKLKKCKVMYDYRPENEDELELFVGQIIDFIREVEEGWWEGSFHGKTGVFPSNFVMMVEEGEGGEQQDDGSKTVTGEADTNFQEIRGKKVVGVGLGNIFGGGPIKLRTTAKKGDSVRAPKTEDKSSRENKGAATSMSEQPSKVERAVVRYSYSADQPDELSLKEGEVIQVLDKHLEDEGWWRGEINGKVGVFPDNFVELLPSVVESPKIPKKPPPPAGKNINPKLPDKGPLQDEKNSSVKKDQARRKSGLTKRRLLEEEAVTEKVTDRAGSQKKPPTVPPVGRKPVLPPKIGEAFNKPEPRSPPIPNRPQLRGKDLSHNHHASVHSNHVADGEEISFDAMESSSHKLVHLTASRAKGPKKRPPSTVLFPADTDKHSTEADTGKGSNHVQAERPPPLASKEHRQVSSPEVERSYRQHSAYTNHGNASRDIPDPRHMPSTPPQARMVEPAREHNSSPENSTLARLVENLQREVRDLRSQSVSKNEYNDLRSSYLRLKQDFDVFKSSQAKKLRELMLEVDEEKKLRLNTQVEMERVKRLLAETHL